MFRVARVELTGRSGPGASLPGSALSVRGIGALCLGGLIREIDLCQV
jgi:hypothetical protein